MRATFYFNLFELGVGVWRHEKSIGRLFSGTF